MGEAAKPGDIKFLQARGVFAQIEPHHRAARARVGERRAVAEEVGQDVQILGEQRRLATARRRARQCRAPAPRSACGPARAAIRQRPDAGASAGRSLRRTPFGRPRSAIGRGSARRMRPPDAVDESRLVGKRHAARGGAEDQRETPARIGRRVARARRRACRTAPACASISPAPTGTPGRKPIAAAASAVRPSPSGAPGATILGADARVIVGLEEPEADASKNSSGQRLSCAG